MYAAGCVLLRSGFRSKQEVHALPCLVSLVFRVVLALRNVSCIATCCRQYLDMSQCACGLLRDWSKRETSVSDAWLISRDAVTHSVSHNARVCGAVLGCARKHGRTCELPDGNDVVGLVGHCHMFSEYTDQNTEFSACAQALQIAADQLLSTMASKMVAVQIVNN